jgi:hypothetical protein
MIKKKRTKDKFVKVESQYSDLIAGKPDRNVIPEFYNPAKYIRVKCKHKLFSFEWPFIKL